MRCHESIHHIRPSFGPSRCSRLPVPSGLLGTRRESTFHHDVLFGSTNTPAAVAELESLVDDVRDFPESPSKPSKTVCGRDASWKHDWSEFRLYHRSNRFETPPSRPHKPLKRGDLPAMPRREFRQVVANSHAVPDHCVRSWSPWPRATRCRRRRHRQAPAAGRRRYRASPAGGWRSRQPSPRALAAVSAATGGCSSCRPMPRRRRSIRWPPSGAGTRPAAAPAPCLLCRPGTSFTRVRRHGLHIWT